MLVRVRFDGKEEKVELGSGSKVSDALRSLGIRREEVLVSRNGEIIPEEETLEDGDIIEVMRVVSGG